MPDIVYFGLLKLSPERFHAMRKLPAAPLLVLPMTGALGDLIKSVVHQEILSNNAFYPI